MKFPRTMTGATFSVYWKSFPEKPGPKYDSYGWLNNTYLDDCVHELEAIDWVFSAEAPPQTKYVEIIIAIDALQGRSLFWAEKEIEKVFKRYHIELDLE